MKAEGILPSAIYIYIYILKYVSYVSNLRKKVETGVDPRLQESWQNRNK